MFDKKGKKLFKFIWPRSEELKFYLVGYIYLIPLFIFIFFILDGKILTTTDVLVPYLDSSLYYKIFYFSGNASLSFMCEMFLSLFNLPPSDIQLIIYFLLILFSYTSLFLLFSYLFKDEKFISLILSILFLNFEFLWAYFYSATGLNFFLAFSPMIMLFFIKINKNEISTLRGISLLTVSIIGSLFVVTEIIQYIILIYFPILLLSFYEEVISKHSKASIINFFINQLKIIASIILSLILLIYMFYPWISVLLSNNSNNSKINQLYITYSSKNFFIYNNWLGNLGNSTSAVGIVLGVGGINTSYTYIIGLIFIVASTIYAIKSKNKLFFFIYVAAILLLIYIQMAIRFPFLLFSIISSNYLLKALLMTINEPAESFYILSIYVYLMLGIMLGESLIKIKNYKSLLNVKNNKKLKNNKKYFMSFLNSKNLFRSSLTLLIVIIIVLSGIYIKDIQYTSHEYYGYSPYGTYKISTHVPKYIFDIYNYVLNDSKNITLGQTLFLPYTPPYTLLWNELSPIFYNFPPSSPYQLQLFQYLIYYINLGIENGSGSILGSLNINYLAIIKVINQTQTGGVMIGYNNLNEPYGLYGNPKVFINYFSNSPDFKIISNTNDYIIFKNLKYSGLNAYYGALAITDFNWTYFKNKGTANNLKQNIMYNLNISKYLINENLLNTPKSRYLWDITQYPDRNVTFDNNTLMLTYNKKITSIDYLKFGIPVVAGMKLEFSMNITSLNNSTAIYANGLDFATINRTIIVGRYLQNGTYDVKPDSVVIASEIYTIPENITYILPWFGFYNANGTFIINNFAIKIISINNNSSFPIWSSSINNLYENNNLYTILHQFDILQNIPIIRYSTQLNESYFLKVLPYHNKVNETGIYVIPTYYVFKNYGYVWSEDGYSTLNPGSSEIGNLNITPGYYNLIFKLTGRGSGIISVNNNKFIYNTFYNPDFCLNIKLNITSSLNISIYNIVGQINLLYILLIGPNITKYQENILSEKSYHIDILKNSDLYSNIIFNMNDNENTSMILVMNQNFNSYWHLKYTIENKTITEQPFIINGWQTGFIIPKGIKNLSIEYILPTSVFVYYYITLVGVPLFLIINTIIYFIYIVRRKKIVQK